MRGHYGNARNPERFSNNLKMVGSTKVQPFHDRRDARGEIDSSRDRPCLSCFFKLVAYRVDSGMDRDGRYRR
jgi:hypothetical protein